MRVRVRVRVRIRVRVRVKVGIRGTLSHLVGERLEHMAHIAFVILFLGLGLGLELG